MDGAWAYRPIPLAITALGLAGVAPPLPEPGLRSRGRCRSRLRLRRRGGGVRLRRSCAGAWVVTPMPFLLDIPSIWSAFLFIYIPHPHLYTTKGEEDRYSTRSKLNPLLLQYSGSLKEYLWTKFPTGSHVSSPGAAPSHLVRNSGFPLTKRCARMRSTFHSPGVGSSSSVSPGVVPNWNNSTRLRLRTALGGPHAPCAWCRALIRPRNWPRPSVD